MPDDLPFSSLTALAQRLARGETTSRAIVEACLARIDALDGKLHAFIDVYGDDALKLADAADLARSAHAARGPLHGLPIALKDLLEVKGRQTTAGSKSWLGRVSDGELAALLRDSLCLAFPSLTEGFGLPALEAMAVGCPVVVSDRASLPEVCGSAALFAPPDDQDAWFDSFVQLRGSQALRLQMIGKGRARASAYSWRATALRYLEAMAAADGVDTETKVVRAREFT